MPIIKSEFKPAPWLKNPHLQTIWAVYFKPRPQLSLHNQRLELSDGDFLDLLHTEIQDKPIVLILHGLEGCIESHYAKPLIKQLEDAGYAVYFMYFRGCSGELNRLPRSYHSGDTADLGFVVKSIKEQHGSNPFAVIGFSLGGNVLLKWLGEQGKDCPVKTAIAVSVPFKLSDAADRLAKSFSRVYQNYLVSRCQRKYKRKTTVMNTGLDVNVDKQNTFYKFDDKITAPLHGFNDANDYYEKSSSLQFIKDIQKPTLIIHAKDDPFMWQDTAPTESDLSNTVELELTNKGGHVGFIGGKYPWKTSYWIESRILEWLRTQCLIKIETHHKK